MTDLALGDALAEPEDPGTDQFGPTVARRAAGVLRAFNDAGVLAAADVHIAQVLARLGGEGDEMVVLAAALAVRAPRLGSVCTDLATVRATVSIDSERPVDLDALPWPDAGDWPGRVAASSLVGDGDLSDARPLHLEGTRLYLDRYWREERAVAADLQARAEPSAALDLDLLHAGLDRLFDGRAPDLQRLAAATAVLRRLAVVAGGPGTGKTTTVARTVALLDEQAAAAGAPLPLVALAAPTGKAAARLAEAVHDETPRLDIADAARQRLQALRASTLHRLLGWRPDSTTRFRHHRGNRLPHDVVIVDETSMVSLSLMAKLLEAMRPDARLVLVGDPEQLASVEAGAVLGDIVGPASTGLVMGRTAREQLERASGQAVPDGGPAPAAAGRRGPDGRWRRDGGKPPAIGDGIVLLRRVHRFGGAIADLAGAIRAGDAPRTLAALQNEPDIVRWIPVDAGEPAALAALGPVRDASIAAARRVTEAARAADGREAIAALSAFRVLCAHRHGPSGVSMWMARIEGWLTAAIEGFGGGGPWYVGRPLLVTQNDYGLGVFNGDIGVVVAAGQGRVQAVFERGGELLEVSPTRLAAVDTVHAMTVHKSQGSQFDAVAVILPDPASRILTRELLYTAVTRARARLLVVGTEAAVRAGVERPIARASGLRERLWAGG